MSLLTVERNSPSPQESDAEETLSSSSHEGFVAREHYVTSLPPRPWASLGRHGGEQLPIFTHLKKVMKLLRNSDTIKLAVELENAFPRKVTKYLELVVTSGYQDTEEAIVLGTEQEDSIIRLGLVMPLWRDTEIKLDGDGGFIVHSGDRQAVFKPSSVQSMWTTLQSLYQATENARQNNYYVGGLSHTWMTFYQSQLTEDYLIRNEWNLMKDIESFRPDSPIYYSQITPTEADNKFEKQLVSKLRGVMLHEDLEVVTSRQLRQKLEKEMDMTLNDYREFLDRHMLRILGQMERPSKILDYLYLGSEWNASNLSELKELGIGYILNVTREIDNFYPEVFKYLNIRLYDVPDSELIKHWDKTYRFIKEAKMMGTKVLVHCKMGISRSAATVIAYMMKEYQMTLAESKKHVKSLRSCINPNDGFMGQLHSYEGILTARHNPRWGRHAPTRLYSKRSMSDPDLMQSLEKEELERGMGEREGDGDGDEEGVGERWKGHPEQQFMHSRPIHNVSSAYNIPNLIQQAEEPELTFLPEEGITKGHTSHPDPSTSLNESTLTHSTPVDKTRNLQNFLASLPSLQLRVSNNDDGIGENIPTSNSGSAYSSPMYTPPDEESIHLLMSQHREQQNREADTPQQFEMNPLPGARDSVNLGQLFQQESASPVCKSTVSPSGSSKFSPPPTSSSNASRHQPQAPLSAVVNMPVTHSHRCNSLPHALCSYVVRGDAGKKPSNVSPTSSRLSISSLARRSPTVQEESRGGEEGSVQEDGSRAALEEQQATAERKWKELCRERPLEPMSPHTSEKFVHHRRTKSDSHDVSGPIKTAQIFSVPERVKEIEEKGLNVTPTQPLQSVGVNQTDLHSSPPASHDNRLSITSSISGSSSEESLTPPFADTPAATDGDKPSSSHNAPVTRHMSLSPKPSFSGLPAQLPAQTSVSLPSSVSPPDCESGSPPPQAVISQDELVSSLQGVVKAKIQDIEGKKGHQQQQSGDKSAQVSEPRSLNSVVKRASPSTIQRPSSEIIFHNPYIGMVEVNNPTDSASHGSSCTKEPEGHRVQQHGTASSTKGLKSNVFHRMDRRHTCEFLSSTETDAGSRIHSEALINAWAGILPIKDLRAYDLASVLELKQKFEVKKNSPKEHRRFESVLRRSRSLRDTRLLSPPVHHSDSAQWQYSSLPLSRGSQSARSSASPPSHNSQHSLSSSIKT